MNRATGVARAQRKRLVAALDPEAGGRDLVGGAPAMVDIGGVADEGFLCVLQRAGHCRTVDGRDLEVLHDLLSVDEHMAHGAVGGREEEAAQWIAHRPHAGASRSSSTRSALAPTAIRPMSSRPSA